MVSLRARPQRFCIASLVLLAILLITSASSANAQSLRITAAGDVTCTDGQREMAPTSSWLLCKERQVANGMKKERPKHVLALGDLSQENGTMEMFNKFSSVWNPVIDLVRPIIGNHEYMGYDNVVEGPDTYFNFWNQRALQPQYLGENQKLWGTWKSNSVRFIFLNSNCNTIECGEQSEQSQWLRSVLEEDQRNGFKGCRVAYFHHPLFSTGIANGRIMSGSELKNLWYLLHKFRTDIILTGHQHYYERYARMNQEGVVSKTGPTQFIVGTGGHSGWNPEGDMGYLLPTSRFALRSSGSLTINFSNNRWSSYFKNISGKKMDQFSSSCLKKPAP